MQLLEISCCFAFQMASPKEWTSSEGDIIEVETPFTVRAKELVQLYNGLKLSVIKMNLISMVHWQHILCLGSQATTGRHFASCQVYRQGIRHKPDIKYSGVD